MGGQETLIDSGSMQEEEKKGREHVCVCDLKNITNNSTPGEEIDL